MGGEVLSGRLGGRVYRNIGGEGFVSAAPQGVDPRTPAQLAARARLDLTNRLWAEVPLDAMERWRVWAATPPPFPSAKGRKRSARADLAFKGLAAKYLQVHGGSAAPTEPPTSAFLGDGIVIRATPSFACERGGRGERGDVPILKADSPPPTPSSPGTNHPRKEGIPESGVVFTPSGPNSQGALTELLLQRLAARHRKPHPEEYRTQRFVAFAGEAVTVPCAAGAWACAVRFVRADTGQETGIVPLGVVEVG